MKIMNITQNIANNLPIEIAKIIYNNPTIQIYASQEEFKYLWRDSKFTSTANEFVNSTPTSREEIYDTISNHVKTHYK